MSTRSWAEGVLKRAHGARRGQGTGRPSASPNSAPGRSLSQSARRMSMSSSLASGSRRRRFCRISATPASCSSKAKRRFSANRVGSVAAIRQEYRVPGAQASGRRTPCCTLRLQGPRHRGRGGLEGRVHGQWIGPMARARTVTGRRTRCAGKDGIPGGARGLPGPHRLRRDARSATRPAARRVISRRSPPWLTSAGRPLPDARGAGTRVEQAYRAEVRRAPRRPLEGADPRAGAQREPGRELRPAAGGRQRLAGAGPRA